MISESASREVSFESGNLMAGESLELSALDSSAVVYQEGNILVNDFQSTADNLGVQSSDFSYRGGLSGAGGIMGSVDRDWFCFTAGATGRITVSVDSSLALVVHQSRLIYRNTPLTLDVKKGETYYFCIQPKDGQFTVFPYLVDVDFSAGSGGGSGSVQSPDLQVTSASASAAKIGKNQSLTFSFTVKNGGKLASGASTARVYAGDTLLGSVECGALAAGASQQYAYQVPAGTLAEGLQYLRVVVDADNRVAEYREDNNASAAVPVQVNGDPLPDLAVSGISLEKSEYSTRETVTVSFSLRNIGTLGAGKSTAGIYVDGIRVGSVSCGALAAGAVQDCSFRLAPGTFSDGGHVIQVAADAGNGVRESNEGNNGSATLPVSVYGTPDLQSGELIIVGSNTVTEGQSIRFQLSFTNTGDASADNFHISVYSDDKLLFRHLWNDDYGAVAPGETRTFTLNLTNKSWDPGAHRLRMVLDGSDKYAEYDETDNASAPVNFVILPGPRADLAVSELTAGDGRFTDTESVTVNFVLRNVGTLVSASTQIKIYDGDAVLDVIDCGALNPGESRNFSWPVPADALLSGSHRIRVVADPYDEQKELSEANNAAETRIVIVPTVAGRTPRIAAEPAAASTGMVSLLPEFSREAVRNEYSTDGGQTWYCCPAILEREENGTLLFRSTFADGMVTDAEYEVAGVVDGAPAPVIVSAKLDYRKDTVDFQLQFAKTSIRNEYSLDGVTWFRCDGKTLSVNSAEGQVYFRSAYASGAVTTKLHNTRWNWDDNPASAAIFPLEPFVPDVFQCYQGEVGGKADPVDYIEMFIEQSGYYDIRLDGFSAPVDRILYRDESRFNGGGCSLKPVAGIKGCIGSAETGPVFLESAVYYLAVSARQTTGYCITLSGEVIARAGNLDDIPGDAPELACIPGNGIADGWVGLGDRRDYYALTLSASGLYSFELGNVENPMTLTLYSLNSKNQLVKIKSVTVKAGCGGLANLLLDSAVSYYLAVEAPKANQGIGSAYDLTVGGEIFDRANSGDDDYRSAPELPCAPGSAISGEWVGYGDKIDYRRLTVSASGKFDFVLSGLSNPVTLTVYTLNSRNGKLSQVKSASVKPGDAKNGLYGLLLDAGGTYYLAVTAPKADKGVSSGYDLAVGGTVFDHSGNALDNNTWNAPETGPLDLLRGVAQEWVGYGDAADCYRFEIDPAGVGNYRFDLWTEVSGAAKMTLCRVEVKNGKSSLKKLASPNGDYSLGAGEYVLEIRSADNGGGNANTMYSLGISVL